MTLIQRWNRHVPISKCLSNRIYPVEDILHKYNAIDSDEMAQKNVKVEWKCQLFPWFFLTQNFACLLIDLRSANFHHRSWIQKKIRWDNFILADVRCGYHYIFLWKFCLSWLSHHSLRRSISKKMALTHLSSSSFGDISFLSFDKDEQKNTPNFFNFCRIKKSTTRAT